MCSLCGTLDDGRHWSDAHANPEAFAARSRTHTWARERQQRTRLLNRVLASYALSVSDWEGKAYLLRASTGRTEIVQSRGARCTAAAAMLNRPCDPLDPALLSALADSSSSSPAGTMAEHGSLIPVNVVTGFLGSGKTTLLSRLLRSPRLRDTAVLVNELGEVGLDHHLLEQVDEQTVLMQNGCLCCSIRGDLQQGLGSLLSRSGRGEVRRDSESRRIQGELRMRQPGRPRKRAAEHYEGERADFRVPEGHSRRRSARRKHRHSRRRHATHASQAPGGLGFLLR